MNADMENATMVYRRNDGAVPGDTGPEQTGDGSNPLRFGSWDAENETEVAALLRLLMQLANCGLDAGAKPLLHTAQSGT